MAEHPRLPVSEKPEDLGFTRQAKMVPWLSPTQLIGTGLRVFLSETFGSYSDKREILAGLAELPPESYSGPPELWLDYVADLGDAFEPTYAIASLLARRQLTLAGPSGDSVTTHRGRMLVMGGDQVYPTASVDAYANQTVGPYRAALPYVEPAADAPHLYTIPGNHDWYDGLTGFMRTFCRGEWVGGWKTRQTRSYFAVQLPHRWWLWGLDFQFDSYIDEPQFRYFADTVGPAMAPGDSVILCTPTPAWVSANEEEGENAYGTLDYLDRKLIRNVGAEVRLMITGDAHHYARYAQTDGSAQSPSSEGRTAQSPSSEGRTAQSPSSEGRTAQKVTAGGGGAFLSSTHNLPETLVLPPLGARDPGKTDPPTHWRLEQCYPSKSESRKLRLRAFRLPFENRGLWVLVGLLHLAYAWMAASAVRYGSGHFADFMSRVSYWGLVRALARNPLAIAVTLAVVWGMAGFTKTGVTAKKWGLGGAHAVVQLFAVLLSIAVSARICSAVGLHGAAFGVVFVILVGVGGGLLGCEVMAVYLIVADRFGLNNNELFAAQRNRDWKNFVRMHVGVDGVLTVYPVAVDHTPRKWQLRKGGDDDAPWFEPDGGPVDFRLIEAPICIQPATPPPAPAIAPVKRAAREEKPPKTGSAG